MLVVVEGSQTRMSHLDRLHNLIPIPIRIAYGEGNVGFGVRGRAGSLVVNTIEGAD